MENIEKTKKDFIIIMFASFVASFLFNIVIGFYIEKSFTIEIIKISILKLTTVIYSFLKNRKINVFKYLLVLLTFVGTIGISETLVKSAFYKNIFDTNSFIDVIGGNIVTKIIASIILVSVLLILYRDQTQIFLRLGDLNVKASKISALGISANKITWKKLSIISGFLISIGTFILTYITALHSNASLHVNLYFRLLPYVLIFAIINSFTEGIMFRNSIMGPLNGFLPKHQIVIFSAIIYGSFHFYGVPSGFLGVIMASILGWFMARSLYETKGILSAWIIHFFQDFVIFSTLIIFGNFIS